MPIFCLLYSRQYFPYILFALFLAVVPLYFVSGIFIAVLPLCFLRYIHGSAALTFCTLYPWLYEVMCCRDSPITWWWNAWSPKARVTVKFLEERECKYEPASCDKIAKHHAGQDENPRKLSEGKRQFENQKKDNMLCSVSSLT